MTFKLVLRTSLIACLVLALSGCPGTEENISEPGLLVHLAQTHYQAEEVVGQLAPAVGAYAQDQLEHHTLRDKNGVQLSLYRTYFVINNIELQPCTTSVTQVRQRLVNFIFPSAHAHAGHGSEPVGGRALDKPNVIDLITQDRFVLPLGDRAIAPGRYCGLQVAIVRLSADAYGKPLFAAASNDDPIVSAEIPEMSGKIFAIRSDYCAERDSDNRCVRRQSVDIDDAGLNEPITQTLTFNVPLELNATLREAYIVIGVEYDRWLVDIDSTLLESDISERQKLLNNINASFRVYDQGLGDLPANSSD